MTQISFFNRLPKKGQPHVSSGDMSLEDFLLAVKFGKWKDIITPIRNEPDKDKRSALKRNLISVTISGTFDERKGELLKQHSGFIAIDIDKNNNPR
jgi:hypothetical protein